MSDQLSHNSARPVLELITSPLPPKCRLCPHVAELVNRPGASDAYHYCARCVTAALERYDLEH